MNFDLDVFVSYAHLDNAALFEGHKGWVANLHRALEIRVGQFLGKSPHIFRDTKLQGNDAFADTLVDLLKHAAVLVSIVSPRYVRSEWTRRELSEFVKAAEQQGVVSVQHKGRIFKVLKTPVPLEEQTPELRALLGYEFFKVDQETGKPIEYDEVFGPEAQRNFWITLDDLAHDLCDLLKVVEDENWPATRTVTGPGKGIVFLAETTTDLKAERETIKRDLQQHGYTVLPDCVWSLTGAEVEASVREDLARCVMSIHLVGKRYGLTPEGATASIVEVQNELAIERGTSGGFTRLVWIPQGLKAEDARQQQVIDRFRGDPRTGKAADLLECPLDGLQTVIYTALERGAPPKPAAAAAATSPGPAGIYLVYDERDAPSVGPWADFLFEQGFEVMHPAFHGDETEVRECHEENLRTSDAVVMFLGAASELWLRRKFREVQKSAGYGRTKPAPLAVVCLLPPRTAEKDRFRTHEAIVVSNCDGLSLEPWQPIISRLKG